MISKLTVFFHTIKYLKLSQIVYRLYYFFLKPSLKQIDKSTILERDCKATFPCWMTSFFSNDGKATFLNKTISVDFEKSWNINVEALWEYNLHYFDDLNSIEFKQKKIFHKKLVQSWIKNNTDPSAIAWQPYPTSLRLVNWCKYFWRCGEPPFVFLQSLAVQSEYLYRRPEYHLLGNHLYANGKALIFAGAFFDGVFGERLLKKGLEIIDNQNDEQFLEDGGHFELSPMYHHIMLWDLLELISLGKQVKIPAITKRINMWESIAIKAITWMKYMAHPDGNVAFFNDSTLGIAPCVKDIEAFADILSIPIYEIEQSKNVNMRYLSASGYNSVWTNKYKAILDTAKIGPDYLPGHAHADTLSFELSVNGFRLLVNSGISQYGNDKKRMQQRATRSHNVVEIANSNSSHIWGGFRVAKRAYPIDLETKKTSCNCFVSCSHSGYVSNPIKTEYRRQWIFSSDEIKVIDSLSGSMTEGKAFFYLHPDCKSELRNNKVLVSNHNFEYEIIFSSGNVSIHESEWFCGFGEAKKNKQIVVVFKEQLTTEIVLEDSH